MNTAALNCASCGQVSTDDEFCSECGAAMGQAVACTAAPSACPVCGEARPGPLARFCDTCRYDFLEKKPFSAAPPPPVAPTVPRWTLLVTVDLSLRRADDPMPADEQPRIFPLDRPDQLIGRGSDSENIHPELTLTDPGISRRHLRIMLAADGAVTALDLGSMNGTRLNAARLAPNVPTKLNAGDALTLGCWTRLKLQTR